MQVKNLLIRFLYFFVLLIVVVACTESTSVEEDRHTLPTSEVEFFIYPNDGAFSDSVDYNITKKAVFSILGSQGSYKLSVQLDSFVNIPKLSIFRSQCDGMYDGIFKDGVVSYEFSCPTDFAEPALLRLENEDFSEYGGKAIRVKLEGDGKWTNCLSLNFVVAGKYGGTKDSVSIDSLAKKIKEEIPLYYDICVDSVYITKASSHPVYGALFRDDEYYVAVFDSIDNFPDMTYWPDKRLSKALDIVLLDYFESSSYDGCSPMYGWDTEKRSVKLTVRKADETLRSSNFIVIAALHEIGHYFGLRHTSISVEELGKSLDQSIIDDGLYDTELCACTLNDVLLLVDSLKNSNERMTDEDEYEGAKEKVIDANPCSESTCGEYRNLMCAKKNIYPSYELSPSQRNIVKRNFTLIPH